jgi:hypothetical protein
MRKDSGPNGSKHSLNLVNVSLRTAICNTSATIMFKAGVE